MRALTVHQPWALMIALGFKTIENREWCPPEDMLGRYIAIHAGQQYDYLGAFSLFNRWGIVCRESNCDKGAIIAVARLVDVVVQSDDPWFQGPYGWVLEDVRFIDPVPCAGNRKLWLVPEAVEEQVRLNIRHPRPLNLHQYERSKLQEVML